MNSLFTCMRNEAKDIPGCNTPAAKAALERIISTAKQYLGMSSQQIDPCLYHILNKCLQENHTNI